MVWRLIHGVGFPGASVAVRKDGDVVAVKEVNARLVDTRLVSSVRLVNAHLINVRRVHTRCPRCTA